MLCLAQCLAHRKPPRNVNATILMAATADNIIPSWPGWAGRPSSCCCPGLFPLPLLRWCWWHAHSRAVSTIKLQARHNPPPRLLSIPGAPHRYSGNYFCKNDTTEFLVTIPHSQNSLLGVHPVPRWFQFLPRCLPSSLPVFLGIAHPMPGVCVHAPASARQPT